MTSTASGPSISTRVLLVVCVAFALPVIVYVPAVIVFAGCPEYPVPSTDARTRVCNALDASGETSTGFRWWVAVIAPSVVLLASQVVPRCRRHGHLTGAFVVGATIGGWTGLALVVQLGG